MIARGKNGVMRGFLFFNERIAIFFFFLVYILTRMIQ